MQHDLVLDSEIIEETIEMLRLQGGKALVTDIADLILQLPSLNGELASLVVSDLIKDDRRLRLTNNELQLLGEDTDNRTLDDIDFVVVDVETTGAKTPPCRVIEVGSYRISRNRIVSEFQTLVNPLTAIPPFISRLTGITDDMVRDAPIFADIATDWLRFAEGAVLVAHNASFDTRFLNYEVARLFPGRRMANTHLCTVGLSRRILPALVNHRLQTVAEHFSISIANRHRAAGDALATARIFLHMLDMFRQHDVRNLSEVRRFRCQKL